MVRRRLSQFGQLNPFERPNPFDRDFPRVRSSEPLAGTTVSRSVPTPAPVEDRRERGRGRQGMFARPSVSAPQRQFEPISYGPPPHYGRYAPPYVTEGPLGERHYRMPAFDIPLPPPEAAGAWGGGGAGAAATPPGQTVEEPVPITWSEFDYKPRTAPDWWKAMKPSEIDPQTEYLASVNMMIPFLSPEDQMTVASQLYITDPENFGHLNPEEISPPGIAPRSEPRDRHDRVFFGSQERSLEALNALTKLKEATGKEETDFGPGYHFLRSLATTVGRYGSPGLHTERVPDMMTRQQALSLMGALDPLLAMGRSEPISAYGPIAQSFGSPFFSGKPLLPMTQIEEGRYMFGRSNPLFRF